MSVLHTFFMVPKNGSTSCEECHEHIFPKCQHKSTSKPSQLRGALLFSSVSRLVAGKLDMHCHGRGIGRKGQCQEVWSLLHALEYLLINVLIHIMFYIYSFVYRQCVSHKHIKMTVEYRCLMLLGPYLRQAAIDSCLADLPMS